MENFVRYIFCLLLLAKFKGGGWLGESIGSAISRAHMHNYFQLKGPVAPTNFGNC